MHFQSRFKSMSVQSLVRKSTSMKAPHYQQHIHLLHKCTVLLTTTTHAVKNAVQMDTGGSKRDFILFKNKYIKINKLMLNGKKVRIFTLLQRQTKSQRYSSDT